MNYILHAIAVIAALAIIAGFFVGGHMAAKARHGRIVGSLILLFYGAWLLRGSPNLVR